jgi:hypothetical protein
MYVSTSSTRLNTERPLIGAQTDVPILAAIPGDERVLILGSGIGAVALGLMQGGVSTHIDCVDYSSDAMKICEAITGSALSYSVLDAAEFVRLGSRKYDYIVVDLFNGPQLCEFVTTETFLEQVLDMLDERGALVINTLGLPPHLDQSASCSWSDDWRAIAGVISRADAEFQITTVPHLVNRTVLVSRTDLQERLDFSSRSFVREFENVSIPKRMPTIAPEQLLQDVAQATPHAFADFRDEVRRAKVVLAERLFAGREGALNEIVANILAGEDGEYEMRRLIANDEAVVFIFGNKYHTSSWQQRRDDWSWFGDMGIALDQSWGCAVDWHVASAKNAVHASLLNQYA